MWFCEMLDGLRSERHNAKIERRDLMSGASDRFAMLVKDSALPITRIRFYAEADRSILQQIPCGVLFVMAFWSVQSRLHFRQLTEVIVALDQFCWLELVVVDTDGCSDLLLKWHEMTGEIVAGYGETAWVKDGQIICTSGVRYDPACFVPNTAALLKECSVRLELE
jgi:hypothetical protein